MQPNLIVRDDRQDNLQLNEDTGRHSEEPVAVFLFTPDMDNLTDHYHIELDVAQARRTYDWMGEFLAKHDLKHRCAAIERLEELALSLEHNHHPDMRKVGAEIRNRLTGVR